MTMDAMIRFAWVDERGAHMTVRVRERWGMTEYHGVVPLATWQGLTTDLARRAALRVAVKAVRDAQLASPVPEDLTLLDAGTNLTL